MTQNPNQKAPAEMGEPFEDWYRATYKDEPYYVLSDDGGYEYRGQTSTAYTAWFNLTRTHPTTEPVDETVIGETCQKFSTKEEYQRAIAVDEMGCVIAALENLANAKALSGVQQLVLGWNGPDGKNERHPSRLGARIETNCGRIYELFDLLANAQHVLADIKAARARLTGDAE